MTNTTPPAPDNQPKMETNPFPCQRCGTMHTFIVDSMEARKVNGTFSDKDCEDTIAFKQRYTPTPAPDKDERKPYRTHVQNGSDKLMEILHNIWNRASIHSKQTGRTVDYEIAATHAALTTLIEQAAISRAVAELEALRDDIALHYEHTPKVQAFKTTIVNRIKELRNV